MVQTLVVELVNVGVSPEFELAVSFSDVPKFCVPGLAKLIVCGALGVTLLEAAEAKPAPLPFVAVTVKVYAVPLVSPVIAWVKAVVPAFASVPPEGFEVTVYPVIAAPPFDAGAVKLTDACVLPAVAVPMVGAPGTVAGITLLEASEAELVPALLVAVTVKV